MQLWLLCLVAILNSIYLLMAIFILKKDRDLIKKNISLIKIICKKFKKTDPNKVFASKLCKIYISLIEIILNILEVGETDYYNWFKLVNQTKIDNLEDQLDDLYQIIGYEMYILYGLVPPKDLVAQDPFSVDLVLKLKKKTKMADVKFSYVLNGPKKDEVEEVVDELISANLQVKNIKKL